MKKNLSLILLICLLETQLLGIQVFHEYTIFDKDENEFIWEQKNVAEFDELIVSWNAQRPVQGYYLLQLSVMTKSIWSPWLQYAEWGNNYQKTFKSLEETSPVKIFQDCLEILNGYVATGFKIRIEAHKGANLNHLRAIHACTSTNEDRTKKITLSKETNRILNVPHLSQMCLDHPRKQHLCSPTATTALLRYLKNDPLVDPVEFAENIWDSGFDIYGNWIFCTAQAAEELGNNWYSWVTRLSDFDAVLEQLEKNIPVVMSIRGPLRRSCLPYTSGHLVLVVGYNPILQEVLCMDSAFLENEKNYIAYAIDDFLEATKRRGNVAYFFKQSVISNN